MQKIKLYIVVLLAVGFSGSVQAQIKIGSTGDPHPSAMLDMNSSGNNRLGALFPLIPINSSTDRTAISSPADFLTILSPYANDAKFPGLNYWHNDKWNHLLNQTELYDSISAKHIAQIVLFAEQTVAEGYFHVTDPSEKAPYRFRLNSVLYDSQAGFADSQYEILDDGIYEITCDVAIEAQSKGEMVSMQTFVRVDGKNMTNDLITFDSTNSASGSVSYTGKFTEGQLIAGCVGAGSWKTTSFRVLSSSLMIVKY
ncbi:MAG: hypothetical protein LBJ60_02870 [Tannerellaceae bacterium]|jgi:hypothetical protein|nr:hypothetical protein [Tannerellaceae bacterium]